MKIEDIDKAIRAKEEIGKREEQIEMLSKSAQNTNGDDLRLQANKFTGASCFCKITLTPEEKAIIEKMVIQRLVIEIDTLKLIIENL